jgi:antitoxin ParD1/3/4
LTHLYFVLAADAMPVRKTRNVSLTPELEAFIDNRVASGRYGNASEVVRAALRLLIEQEQRARATKASNRQ